MRKTIAAATLTLAASAVALSTPAMAATRAAAPQRGTTAAAVCPILGIVRNYHGDPNNKWAGYFTVVASSGVSQTFHFNMQDPGYVSNDVPPTYGTIGNGEKAHVTSCTTMNGVLYITGINVEWPNQDYPI
ncbi:MAG: hypothetical protein J2P25_21605 [Nocardiopsaceae bacterium]|nr:hypothetical protein [Nocardiopsaceae bacterium]